MLEDKTIQHLISWTQSSESFVMQPSHEFSKVLAYVDLNSRQLHFLTSVQAIFQAHQYLFICAAAQHVRLP